MYNRVELLGRLGADPELVFTKNTGTKVCRMRVATSERWKGKDGEYEDRTEWHNVKAFGKTAENCAKYLKKGRLVFVEGALHTDSWEKDGVKQYRTEIVANANGVKFVEPKDALEKREGGNLMDVREDVPGDAMGDYPFQG